jgi:Ca-activated chloride channel homolog
MSVMHAPARTAAPSTGGRLVTPDGRTLPFLGGALAVDAKGGLARVTLRQRFHNPYDEPLRVTYQVPLPSDAAVSGYAFELPTERIEGEVDTRHKARQRFEEALIEGRSAALLEQERSSLFTQEVGNIPPHSTVVCELRLDQLLAWDAVAGGWTWRFPTVVAPRYQGTKGRVADAAKLTVDVATGGTDAQMGLHLSVRDACTAAPRSPSHPLHVVGNEATLREEGGVALDRDIVVSWPVAAPSAGVSLDLGRAATGRSASDHACGLLTLVPPTSAATAVPRDLVVLLDTSGSMGGAPLRQAKQVTEALINSLGEQDQLQVIEFSVRPRAWKRGPVQATTANKALALSWLAKLRAGGGTEMKTGILEALATLRGEAQRQVVLVTDGLIGFEREIVGAVMQRLPRGCRVHTVGIGSGVNRSLLTPVARAGGGIEVIVGINDKADAAADALVRATGAPQVVDLRVEGPAVLAVDHHSPPDLMQGRPSRLALRLRPEGGRLTVRGTTQAGPWQADLEVPAMAAGEGSAAVVTLVGRERVADLELKASLGEDVNAAVEALGIGYQISTRRTSWVAVSHALTVDPTAPTRSERVPQALPHGMSAEGVGLRAAMPPMARAGGAPPPMMSMPAAASSPPTPTRSRRKRAPQAKKAKGVFRRVADFFSVDAEGEAPPPPGAAPQEFAADDLGSRASAGSTADLREEPAPAAESLPPMADEDLDDAMPDTLEDAEEEFELEEAAEKAATSPSPYGLGVGLSLPARLILGKGDRLTIQVDLPQALRWSQAGRLVTVHLSRGRTVQATLVPDRTTRDGLIPAGASLRLTLTASGLGLQPYQVVRVHLTADSDGGPALTLSL